MPVEVEGSRKVTENDWFYDLVVPEKPDEEAATEDVPKEEQPTDEAPVEEQPSAEQPAEEQPVTDPEKVETASPEYKSTKKYIPLDNEREIYDKLAQKYRYDGMKPEEKAIAYIAKENPGLDDEEILFIAASDYGIGVEKPNMDDLTDEQAIALRKQDIARKQLLNKADTYFKQEAEKITIDGVDPLEEDEGFKSYRTAQAEANAQAAQREQNLQNTLKQIETAAKTITELRVPTEIDIDDRKFAVEVNFRMDADKQKKLVDFTRRYTPTDEEMAQYTTDGKFDFRAYQAELANRLFYKDIVRAALRQGLSQDREQFIEKELKNSTLRNNDVSETREAPFDFVDYYFDKYAGR